jgi:anti-sigma factor RsiW
MSWWRREPEADGGRRTRRSRKVVCRDWVEQVTDYLEGALSDDEVARIDAHLEECGDCARVLAQWREVIRLTGQLGDHEVAALSSTTRDDLIAAFRDQPVAPD